MNVNLSICVTCLCTDRQLVPLDKIRQSLKEIWFMELQIVKGGICWECRGTIIKYCRFKMKALQAQTLLSQYDKAANIKPLSSLGVKTNLLDDYQFSYEYDPLINCDTEPKIEESNIKEEYDETSEDNHSEVDEKSTEVYVENVTHNEEDGVRNTKVDEELNEKFMRIVFTEEEMIKNREDKRNQPNFKKIPYKCDSCVLGFTRKENYDVHMKKKHDESIGPYSCDICLIRFSSILTANNHRQRHYTCFRCRLCRYDTTELYCALNHCKMKHRNDRLDQIHCAQCTAVVKQRHYTCYRCRLCRYDTTELYCALNHCKMKHRNDRLDQIHCAQCTTVVKNSRELEEHVQTHHTLYCNECGVRFKGKHTLNRHKVRIHTIKREFICDLCRKTFNNKTRLESHMVTHNALIAKKLSYCNICNVQYKNLNVYRSHLKNSVNHSERNYSCPECNKKFTSKVYWTKHYNFYHLHKSQYNCEICNKLFISEWRLKNHRQKHHGLNRPRDHPCNICGKTFYTTTTLRNHQLTHSVQRRYMCEDCGDTFKQRAALYTHSKLVHGDGRKK